MSEVWKAGSYNVALNGDDGVCIFETAGWIKGPLGIDFRVYDIGELDYDYSQGWALTHIPTGYSIFGLLMPLDEAKEAVDFILSLGDWDFKEPEGSINLTGILPTVIAEFEDDVTRISASMGPQFQRALTKINAR